MRAQVEIPKQRLKEFCRKWKITEFALFGSVLRDDFRPESDVDVIVSFSPYTRWTLFDLARMEEELKAIFGHEVDLAERKAVESSANHIRRRHILASLEPIDVAG